LRFSSVSPMTFKLQVDRHACTGVIVANPT
jgi:hypothetical protein